MNRTSNKVAIGLMVLVALTLSMSFKASIFQQSGFVAPASADAKVNPVKGDAAATAAGKKLYDINCAVCHGSKGQGDGVAAAGLSKVPANHTSAAVQKQSDGALFWKITEGKGPMPAYKATYTETQRWQLVNYIRTLAKPGKK
jgi:mono/diheme cytochrome c family protein